ncbi:MFS transporter [Streptomyces alanosinicus]|uniref:MFS transporter n=1 Tax=Streptomyces alanosinicus TaxID=68171 RepID=A0A918YRN2_9ACTN|nr:MFS transporter [Streptomyces alanosinicus]GHE12645.1 MFS transporter [Streptomyces alanosinicus]
MTLDQIPGTPSQRHATTAAPGAGISRPLVLLLAVACGLIVANNYYAQPLLPDFTRALHISTSTAGLTVTLNQLGYAVGLVLLVPLGDLLARRTLVTVLLSIDTLALLAAALAPGAFTLIAMLTVAGISGCAINILIPAAATLARDDQRGGVVGTLMTGLLLGILLARTVAGAIDEAIGWRWVYGIAALAIAVLTLALRLNLPDLPAGRGAGYPKLLASVATLVRNEPFLRRRMAIGAIGFCCFQLLWTALPFMLSGAPYHYSAAVIGLFGLLGAAGAGCAQPAGRLEDRGAAHAATGVLLLVIGAAWALSAGGTGSLALLIAGILVLDIGVQGVHVLNQARMYGYPAHIRSRVTSAYMTAYFLGGSLGGALGVALYTAAGWAGVCATGGTLTILALLLWLTDRHRSPTGQETPPA